MSDGPLVLVLDVGSSAVKGALYDARARLVRHTLVRQPATIRLSADGGADEDPRQLARLVEKVIDAVLERKASRIAAVGLDTMAFTTCGVADDGRPLTRLFTYADSRSRDDVRALADALDVAAAYRRTGCPLHTAYLPARLHWLRHTSPEWSAVRRWLDLGSYLYGRWFGRPAPMSYSMASWSGLLDRTTLTWDAELLGILGLDADVLPQLAEFSAAERGLERRWARRWPALRDVPFFLGVGDGAAANVGSGCVTRGRVALTVGTTGAMRVIVDEEVPDIAPGLWAYKVTARETLLGGALNEGGDVFAWARSAFQLPAPGRLDRVLASLRPDAHGLTVLPFITGERSPGWSTGAQATIHGISGATSGVEMLQACLEAVAYRVGFVGRLLAPHLARTHEIVASGGAMSGSPYWVQLMADVLEQPIQLSHEAELTSRGTAILALRALGLWRTLEDVPLPAAAVHAPDPKRGAIYREAMERQHRLYDTLIGHANEIAQRLARGWPQADR